MKKLGIPPKTESYKIKVFKIFNKDISMKIGKINGNVFTLIGFSLESYPDNTIIISSRVKKFGIEILIS